MSEFVSQVPQRVAFTLAVSGQGCLRCGYQVGTLVADAGQFGAKLVEFVGQSAGVGQDGVQVFPDGSVGGGGTRERGYQVGGGVIAGENLQKVSVWVWVSVGHRRSPL
ncbi:hypothetical protein ACIBHY_50940 [Nonomuraea sp. NPDC050547]|uniref:hypothetical protein n=1 Tax=Nonomuraea sp. NPDC050547 TaxID=3364368 RepID=UPI0037BAF616